MGTPDNRPLTQLRQSPAAPKPTPAGSRVFSQVRPGDHPAVRSLYIHVPFCVHKCHYCDFYSIVDTQDRMDAFVDRLSVELRSLTPHTHGEPLETVFVGGGTPSLLGPARWERLLDVLHDTFCLSKMRKLADPPSGIPEGEFTVECNPESTTPELCALFAERGVNRISIGAQSFNARHLKTLERWHDPANVPKALEAARDAGIPRQSLDLIYAIPGQTLDDWASDLDTALGLGTTHLSCYNLTYEPNTAMTARLRAGEFQPLDEETEIQMFEMTREKCHKRGLVPYEVSNFALNTAHDDTQSSGYECRHNLAYWRQRQWLAAGPSASGHVFASHDPRDGGWRWKNTPRLGDYLAGEVEPRDLWYSPTADVEPPEPARGVRERLMTGLRLREGLDAESLVRDAETASAGSASRLAQRARPYLDRGLLVENGVRWTLSEPAMLRADGIAADLMRAIPS